MGSKAPKAPPAPNPNQVAGAQTGSNVATAIANSWLQNANERGPLGNVDYKVSSYQKIGDPSTGNTYDIPIFTRTTTLDPAQKKLLDQQNKLGSNLNNMAIDQTGRLADHLGKPIDLKGLPGMPTAPKDLTNAGLPALDANMEGYRRKVEGAMFERMNPQLDRDYSSLENRLINQGLVRGSEAFTRAMDEHGRNANDARTQVFLASGNEARAQNAEQRNNRTTMFNERVAMGNDARANDELALALRERALQERMHMRNQPINEITALMGGGQVTVPQFSPYNAGSVAGTPIGDYIYNSANLQRQDANTAAQARGQIFNSIGNIASAGLFKFSDARLKTDVVYVGTDQTTGLRWYTYRYIGSAIQQFGVIAQEVMKVRPDAVAMTESGYYAVNYGAL